MNLEKWTRLADFSPHLPYKFNFKTQENGDLMMGIKYSLKSNTIFHIFLVICHILRGFILKFILFLYPYINAIIFVQMKQIFIYFFFISTNAIFLVKTKMRSITKKSINNNIKN